MIYLDNGATSFPKPPQVCRAVDRALHRCANACREAAAELFACPPERVVLTTSCTHGLNIALGSLVKPGAKVVVSGFEHNAVTRPLTALGAKITVAGRKLFDREDTLENFRKALKEGMEAAVFTHVSNVFGYILPVEELAELCRKAGVPFVLDAAQSAGSLPVSMKELGADFIAMPGHKGLLGPQGTGLLLCKDTARPLLYGGTGTDSRNREMPDFLPERLEPGTLNVPGFAGLTAGIRHILKVGPDAIFRREHRQLNRCVRGLQALGMRVFTGPGQAATVSFLPGEDCEEAARLLAEQGIAVRAGLHCAPFAHESAGTLETGTVRVSFGADANEGQTRGLLQAVSKLTPFSS